MDEQVRKAFKLIQRVGTPILHPEMTLEELKENYGNLLLTWLRNQNINCYIYYEGLNYGPTKSKKLLKYLESNLHQKINLQYYNYLSNNYDHAVSISLNETDSDETIITKTLSGVPINVFNKILQIQTTMNYYKNDHKLCLVIYTKSIEEIKRQCGVPIDEAIHIRICTPMFWIYSIFTLEQLTKIEQIKQQKELKKQQIIQKAQEKKEKEEKALLQKLKEKYETTQTIPDL